MKIALIVLILVFSQNILAQSPGKIRILGHIPSKGISQAQHLGRVSKDKQISLTVALKLRNQSDLDDLLKGLYDPKDSRYGRFLSSAEFSTQFGPAPDDIAQVREYLESKSLSVGSVNSNTIQVSGRVDTIEKAFNLEMHQYLARDGRQVFAPNVDPEVDSSISDKISGVLGLNNFNHFVAFRHKRSESSLSTPVGSGPGGGLSPSDIQKAYGFSGGAANGSGETLALMELDGYAQSDISQYASQFKLHSTPLQNILVDGFDGSAGDGADEVTLDIELMMAVAPSVAKILVYEGPNSESGPLDVYAKIASDNIAKEVSTSWGSPESQNTSAYLNSENSTFQQMAAQGQSIYAAAGDSGAYDDGTNLGVDDPASQPFVVGTGGTTLSLNSDGSYKSESSWGIPAQGGEPAQGGGGGISATWPIPSWQANFATSLNKGSGSMRMVPDISLDANPETGYAIYVGGSWNIYGGTSCAAPLWAAFTALANQQRVINNLPLLGFPNLAIYELGKSNLFSTLFKDIKDSSTNLFYPAVSGYDLSTGFGTMNAAALITSLSGASSVALTAPVNVTVTPHNQVATVSWPASPGALSYTVARASSSAGPYSIVVQNVLATSYTDVGLQNGVAYFYEVESQNLTSLSGASAAVSATPTLMVPQAPGSLTAVPMGGN